MCNRCGHIWVPDKGNNRTAESPPLHCAKCKSRRWNDVPSDIPKPDYGQDAVLHGARVRKMRALYNKDDYVPCGPTYLDLEKKSEPKQEFQLEPTKHYMLKCNVCDHQWITRNPGHIPRLCPKCHTEILKFENRRKYEDHHGRPVYTKTKYCNGCRAVFPIDSPLKYCSFCNYALRSVKRGKHGEHWDKVKYPEAKQKVYTEAEFPKKK